jgi:hypothetical protein
MKIYAPRRLLQHAKSRADAVRLREAFVFDG